MTCKPAPTAAHCSLRCATPGRITAQHLTARKPASANGNGDDVDFDAASL